MVAAVLTEAVVVVVMVEAPKVLLVAEDRAVVAAVKEG